VVVKSLKYVIYGLKETYYELGEYEFKIVLDPKHFSNSHLSEIKCVDSDGRKMKFHFEKWGRKINCKFILDKDVSDGVSRIEMLLKDDEEHQLLTKSSFWVIKP
jgi:hypothetical protein